MERRGFLGAILAAGLAPAFVGAKVLMPVRAIHLPYHADAFSLVAPSARPMIYPAIVTSEMIRILENNLQLSTSVNREYEERCLWGPRGTTKIRTIKVARPRALRLQTS